MTHDAVSIIDYGAGNLLSLTRAFAAVGVSTELISTPDAINRARYLVLPGVGAFGHAMDALRAQHLVEPIRAFVGHGGPFLGICLGMQMMMENSVEFGVHEGLGLIAGDVRPIESLSVEGVPLKIPHVGWSPLHDSGSSRWSSTILADLSPGDSVYFVHSFMGHTINSGHCLAYSEYGGHQITAVIGSGRAMGCQFHPEKSGTVGLTILRRFARLADSDVGEVV